jgi:hypothetical protein
MRTVIVPVLTLREEKDGDVWVVVEKNYPGMHVHPSAHRASGVWQDLRIPITTGISSKKVS